MNTKLTPNIKKLVFQKMSLDAVPHGGGMRDAIDFLQQPQKIASSFKKSYEWVIKAISVIRNTKEPNPYKDLDDEEIAAILLDKVSKRKNNERVLRLQTKTVDSKE